MDHNSTPYPGKSRPIKPKFNRTATKALNKEPPQISRQRRVFGTVRNTNVPVKTVTEKPIIKPISRIAQKQPKSTQTTLPTTDTATEPVTEAVEQSTPEKTIPPKLKKKSVSFPEEVEEKDAKNLEANNVVLPKTPVGPRSLTRAKSPGTPYHSAENCSKCRFDRLETSSYWLSQIKLAESVGKHFVSAAFFGLAFESKAEPIRSLRVELKRYLVRHGYLSEQTEWREVSVSYGLLKDRSNTGEVDSGVEQSGTWEPTGNELDQEQTKEHFVEETESKTN
ncbi:uncharacterized protein LOC115988607 [Quercus lobata]|uniref:Uncharacterized protein n=1 Tax=Quercus lobata TaxID=97700 RepID=A0A7N2KNK3_QUELO|nr:uncharacterized protein LOC115988607 [Quercus lobata]